MRSEICGCPSKRNLEMERERKVRRPTGRLGEI